MGRCGFRNLAEIGFLTNGGKVYLGKPTIFNFVGKQWETIEKIGDAPWKNPHDYVYDSVYFLIPTQPSPLRH